ncbi:hypothetical protein ES705_26475 [subsurface metagenome]
MSKCVCSHFEVNFSIDVCGIYAHMTKPGTDCIDVNTSAQEEHCGRVTLIPKA